MLDIELIRSDPEFVRAALLKRVDDVDLAPILAADALRRKLATEVDGARSERNRQAREIGKLKASGADTAEVQKQAAALGDRVTAMQAALTAAEETLEDLLMGLPNLPDERSPAGGKEANQVVRTWGRQPDLGDKPLDHVELCTRLGLIDYARGVKLGGNGYWIYTGQGAALEWALLDFFNREHYAAGYQFMLPPHLLTEESGYAAGQFPKFHDDVFHIREEEGGRKSFLLPTSETAIVNVYRDEILPAEMLPVKAFAYSPCYRREAGSYRSEERGSIRGHQFNKVEMFQFTAPEDAEPTAYVHTLNASGLATSRLLPAIVEQNQQPDGTVIVPEPLRPWLGTDILRPPPRRPPR